MKHNHIIWFFSFVITVIGLAVWWLTEKAGWQIGVSFGIAGFVVLIIFAQQILSADTLQNTLNILVKYDQAQAEVEKERVKIRIEEAQGMKEILKVESRITGDHYDQLQIAARKMAGFLSDAEIAKVKAEMIGLGVNRLTDSEYDLDN